MHLASFDGEYRAYGLQNEPLWYLPDSSPHRATAHLPRVSRFEPDSNCSDNPDALMLPRRGEWCQLSTLNGYRRRACGEHQSSER
jgi:hypothetical protein